MDNDNRVRIAYEAARELYNKELDRLFQRLNFFLLGSSFLIIALVTLANQPHRICEFRGLLYAIIVAGIALSIFFTVANRRMSHRLARMWHYIYALERRIITNENWPDDFKLPYRAAKETESSLPSKYEADEVEVKSIKRIAEHTWYLPIGFLVFWVMVVMLLL